MPPRSPGSFFGVEDCVCPGCIRCGGRDKAGRRNAGRRDSTATGQMVGGRQACLAGTDDNDVDLHNGLPLGPIIVAQLIMRVAGSVLVCCQTFFTTPDLSCTRSGFPQEPRLTIRARIRGRPGEPPFHKSIHWSVQGKEAVLHSPCHRSPVPRDGMPATGPGTAPMRQKKNRRTPG
jgi:hypothetical protein